MSDAEDYYVPLVDQRVFGAGLKKRKIAFVPAKDEAESEQPEQPASSRIRNLYLSIVMKDQAESESIADSDERDAVEVCSVCNQPVQDGHATSIAHQVSLPHSQPPSHLDRNRMGLKYLENYGWNADERTGLGHRPDSIAAPIKVKQKSDTAGLGLSSGQDGEGQGVAKIHKKAKADKIRTVGAGEVRRLEHEKWKRGQRLHDELYGQDLSVYLGPNG